MNGTRTVALVALALLLIAATPSPPQDKPSGEQWPANAERKTQRAQTESVEPPASAPAQPAKAAVQTNTDEIGAAVEKTEGNGQGGGHLPTGWLPVICVWVSSWWSWGAINALVSLIAAVAVAVATVYLAIFNSRLLSVTKEMRQATEDSAKASIHAGRPFLLVTEVHVGQVADDRDRITFRALLTLRNFGTGPADIIDYYAVGEVFDAPRQNPDLPGTGDPLISYPDGAGHPLGDPLVEPGHSLIGHIVPYVAISRTQEAEMPNAKRIAFHGRIRYQGTPLQRYETRFFWWWFHPERDQCERCLTREYNSHT